MRPKPKHLGADYAAVFGDQSVVAAYHYRPTYPAELFPILGGLISDEPRVVLDVGCGTGDVARHLTEFVERVDALDISAAMIETGKAQAGGNSPRLRWQLGRAEDAPLEPPYALITAGQSLHWMDWELVMPRLARMLTPRGYLAILHVDQAPNPWDADLRPLFPHFSTNKDFQPYDLLKELTTRHLFMPVGEQHTAAYSFVQPIEEYVESFHARNGLSRGRMSQEAAAEFDEAVRGLVTPFASDDRVELRIRGEVVWGLPQKGSRGVP